MELLEKKKKKKKKHRGNELAVSLFYHVSESLTFFCDFFFFCLVRHHERTFAHQKRRKGTDSLVKLRHLR